MAAGDKVRVRRAAAPAPSSRFSKALMHSAAALYYLEEVTQAEVAARLGVSRATVSRLLSEARREGIVRIEVVAPVDEDLEDLARRTAAALGLDAVHLAALPIRGAVGTALAPALSIPLRRMGLSPGDVMLVSSGRTVYEAAQGELPRLDGVVLAPMIGGQDEPEPWYATNEITRQVAVKVGGTPTFLYAPALPGPGLYERLLEDPSTQRVLEMWRSARCAVVGVGAPPATRTSLPRFAADSAGTLREAVGDVCSRFYDREGRAVAFAGSERLLATELELLREIPDCIALAAGSVKVAGIVVGAAAGYFNQLVTDASTASALLDAVGPAPPKRSVRPARPAGRR
jgi:DNA-binding transcriptional regulator LsrR (DeoR family)